ncbi:ABC transporter ATP-binding protein [Methanobrevibacter sp.]|uniref:ABC transporter ATP-binding protein n=1 Tax=Methanobrevibacter sp. TaxID=66852 RepID=UPI0038639253
MDNKQKNINNPDIIISEQATLKNDINLKENPTSPQENQYNSDGLNNNDDFEISNFFSEKPIKSKIPEEYILNNTISHDIIEKRSSSNTENFEKEKKDIDGILTDLIPDYKKELAIELNHVYLTFEFEPEKIDNLKEFLIRTIKRDKTKKIKFQVLSDITFKIYKGEKIGIIGYNGAGKSTLLSLITGVYGPNKGEVKTYGKISPLLSLGAGFDHNYTGRENIFLNGAVLGYDKKFLESKYDEIVEFSELGKFIDFPIKNYSSGMLAKLGFSIATIVEPDILIIDEVLGVGDVSFQKKSSHKIRSLMDSGTTVLLVSHSIPQIRKLCDKAIWIDKGRVREIGEVNEVCDNYIKDSEKASKEQLKDIRFV